MMQDESDGLVRQNDLKTYLRGLPPGPVNDKPKLIELLTAAWESLEGMDSEKTYCWKLSRLETPIWDPPKLSFDLERHGGTVLGSTRAEVHHWEIDIERATKDVVSKSVRQVRATDKRLDVKSLAAEVASAIVSVHLQDSRIKWLADGKVQVNIGSLIPKTNTQTTAGRRRRFYKALDELLAEEGWVRSGTYYRKSK